VITLRNYEAGDLVAMFQLDEACFEEPFRFSHTAMRRFAESHKARVVIADSDGVLAGFAILHVEGHTGYIVTLDVAVEFRRRGVAGQLMQAMEQRALEAECAVVGLHVFVGNQGAILFYERSGYQRVGDVQDFYGDGLHAWVYRKSVSKAKGQQFLHHHARIATEHRYVW
jgi:ribosomal-protein-alanine N-acetyltransferase